MSKKAEKKVEDTAAPVKKGKAKKDAKKAKKTERKTRKQVKKAVKKGTVFAVMLPKSSMELNRLLTEAAALFSKDKLSMDKVEGKPKS